MRMCQCGCPENEHHISWFTIGTKIIEECEAFGYNETGGMKYVNGEWVEHCMRFRPASKSEIRRIAILRGENV